MIRDLRFLGLLGKFRSILTGASPRVDGGSTTEVAVGPKIPVAPRRGYRRENVENHPASDLFFKWPEIGHGYIVPWKKSHLVFVCYGPYEEGKRASLDEMSLHADRLINRKGRIISRAVPSAIHGIWFPMSAVFGQQIDCNVLGPERANDAREILAIFAELREEASLPCS